MQQWSPATFFARRATRKIRSDSEFYKRPNWNNTTLTATTAIFTRLLAWRPGGYLRASGTLFGWLALRTAAQTALFVLVARSMGAAGYGTLIAVMAVATFFAPLAGLGGQAVMLRDGARNPQQLAMHLGDALWLWAASVVPLCVLAFVACRLLVSPVLPAYSVAAIVLADVVGASLLEVLARTWQAAQRMAGFGATMTGLILARLAVFCALLAVTVPTPADWALWYGAITAAYLLAATLVVIRVFGRPRRSGISLSSLTAAGFPFAFAGSAVRVQAEANKPILARLDAMAGVGVFSAAQRVTELLLVPLQALLEALLPRAYRSTPSISTIFVLGAMPLSLAVAGGLVLMAGAHWLPVLLGESYAPSANVIRLLAFLPCLFVIRTLLTAVIVGRDGQTHLYWIYAAGAAAGASCTLLLVPSFGLTGAAIAAYGSEVAMIAFQSAILKKARNHQQGMR